MPLALGIHCNHDASVALCNERKVLFSIAEERIANIKHYAGFPFRALKRLFEYTGIDANDVDFVAFSSQRIFYPEHKKTYFILLDGSKRIISDKDRIDKKNDIFAGIAYPKFESQFSNRHWSLYKDLMQELGLLQPRIKHFSVAHHRAHASAAFRMSSVEKGCVLTLDGVGDGVAGTIYSGNPDGSLVLHRSTISVDSLGAFYQAATDCLGFLPVDGEHKTMGLAAHYNNEIDSKNWSDVIKVVDGRMESLIPWSWKLYNGPALPDNSENPIGSAVYPQRFVFLVNKYGSEWFASHVQNNCERAILEYVRAGMKLSQSKNIFCSGGVFLNVKANLFVSEKLCPTHFFVLPDAGDSGLACGAAIEALFQENFLSNGHIEWSPFSGDSYNHKEISSCLLPEHGKNITLGPLTSRLVGKELAEGKIIGVFQGRMEFGPRALGNRSILADPRDVHIRERVRQLKRSESFVPYAPSLLKTDCHQYYDSPCDCRFMTFAVRCFQNVREIIPAVVHIDGTMRPQVVSDQDNSWLYSVLNEFKKITGIGTLLNTSFNSHGSPIVGSPQYAIKNLLNGLVDGLAIGDYYVKRNSKKPL